MTASMGLGVASIGVGESLKGSSCEALLNESIGHKNTKILPHLLNRKANNKRRHERPNRQRSDELFKRPRSGFASFPN